MTDARSSLRRLSSDGPHEAGFGYSRAVRGLIDAAMLVEVELEACVGMTNLADGMSPADPADSATE